MLSKGLKNVMLKIVPEVMVYSFLAGVSVPFLSYYIDKEFNVLTVIISLFYLVVGIVLYKKVYKGHKHWKAVRTQIIATEKEMEVAAKNHGEQLADMIISWNPKKTLIVFSLSLLALLMPLIIVLTIYL